MFTFLLMNQVFLKIKLEASQTLKPHLKFSKFAALSWSKDVCLYDATCKSIVLYISYLLIREYIPSQIAVKLIGKLEILMRVNSLIALIASRLLNLSFNIVMWHSNLDFRLIMSIDAIILISFICLNFDISYNKNIEYYILSSLRLTE